MRKQISFQRNERGQSLVEFAISITALIILLAGAVDFGMALFHYIAMRDAAQEGALYGAMNPPNAPTGGSYTCASGTVSNICSRIRYASGTNGLIDRIYTPANITVDASGGGCEGHTITITFVYPYNLTMPFLTAFIGSNYINLRATVTDTILTPICP
jgi:Flp pilus assembly protein TadG